MAARRQRSETILAGNVTCEVTWKDVRRLSLRVGADGRVRASVPRRTTRAEALAFVRSHEDWVRRQLGRRDEGLAQAREALGDGASVRLWGLALPLVPVEDERARRPRATLEDGRVVVREAAGTPWDLRMAALDALLADELVRRVGELAPALEERVGRHATAWRVRRMTSRWGSCNTRTGRVTLNLALATLDPRCLEGVMAHELCHLWVRAHDARFYELLGQAVPDWRAVRRELRSHEAELRAAALVARAGDPAQAGPAAGEGT